MPIYEYRCSECGTKFRKLVGMIAQTTPLQCPRCSSGEAQRLISRFSRLRSEDEKTDAMTDEMEAMGNDGDDPAAMRRLMKEMGDEMGEDLGDDFEQMLEEEALGGMQDEMIAPENEGAE